MKFQMEMETTSLMTELPRGEMLTIGLAEMMASQAETKTLSSQNTIMDLILLPSYNRKTINLSAVTTKMQEAVRVANAKTKLKRRRSATRAL